MNGVTITKVWEINNQLVVANYIEEAIALYKKYYEEVPVTSVCAVGSNSAVRDYDALIKEDEK